MNDQTTARDMSLMQATTKHHREGCTESHIDKNSQRYNGEHFCIVCFEDLGFRSDIPVDYWKKIKREVSSVVTNALNWTARIGY